MSIDKSDLNHVHAEKSVTSRSSDVSANVSDDGSEHSVKVSSPPQSNSNRLGSVNGAVPKVQDSAPPKAYKIGNILLNDSRLTQLV